MAIWRETVTITTAGDAGDSSGAARTRLVASGIVRAVHIDYGAAPGTTDVVIRESSANPALPVLSVSNGNTDGWWFPVHQAGDADDGADFTDVAAPVVVADHLLVEVDDANNGNIVAVTIVWQDV